MKFSVSQVSVQLTFENKNPVNSFVLPNLFGSPDSSDPMDWEQLPETFFINNNNDSMDWEFLPINRPSTNKSYKLTNCF